MNSTSLHGLHIPSGIVKTNRQGRRPGKSACVACHIRKKRCEIAPPYDQCTHCRKENQTCISRDPIERATRQLGNRNHNHRSQKLAQNKHEPHQFQIRGRPMPPGIDHEIPRWSPLYSFYSEMCRLLPLASTPPSPSSENEENSADIEPTPNKQTADSAPTDDQTGKICIKGIGIPARSQCPPPRDKEVDWEQMLSAYEAGILQGSLASVETQSRNSGRNDVFTNNDLDALENIYTLV